jgi:hypothetical protein
VKLSLKILFLSIFLLTSCEKEEATIKSYRLAKVPLEKLKNPTESTSSSSSKLWTPPLWEELTPGFMRLALFKLKGQTASSWECSISFLKGDSGSEMANINRWRSQINLPHLEDSEIEKEQDFHQSSIGKAKIFKFSSKQAVPLATIVAVFESAEGKHFVKSTGESSLIQSEEENFFKFLDQIHAWPR